MKAIDVAYYIVKHFYSDFDYEEMGEVISNMKLQKLLYYYQGFHLAFFDKPAFEEELKAWQYGPVAPSVYQELSGKGATKIDEDDFTTPAASITEEQEQLLHVILEKYGQFSAITLMNMSHQETPWKSVAVGDTITKDSLKAFFKTKVIQ